MDEKSHQCVMVTIKSSQQCNIRLAAGSDSTGPVHLTFKNASSGYQKSQVCVGGGGDAIS